MLQEKNTFLSLSDWMSGLDPCVHPSQGSMSRLFHWCWIECSGFSSALKSRWAQWVQKELITSADQADTEASEASLKPTSHTWKGQSHIYKSLAELNCTLIEITLEARRVIVLVFTLFPKKVKFRRFFLHGTELAAWFVFNCCILRPVIGLVNGR